MVTADNAPDILPVIRHRRIRGISPRLDQTIRFEASGTPCAAVASLAQGMTDWRPVPPVDLLEALAT